MELIERPGLYFMELITSWYPQGIASKNKQEIARRDEQITELLSAVQDNPARIQALLQQPDYGLPDQRDFYFELRSLLTEALDQVDQSGESLLQVALSQDISWYVRRQAVYFVKARRNPALVARLAPLLTETGLQGEIRATAVTALALHRIEETRPLLLKLYHSLPKGGDTRLGGWTYAEADLLEALGYYGEREVLRPLIALQYHPYRSRRLSGQRGLQALIEQLGGLNKALDLLSSPAATETVARLAWLAKNDASDAVRRWAVEQLADYNNPLVSQTLSGGLADQSWMVANAAAQQLILLPEPPVQQLELTVKDAAVNPTNRFWAAYVLLRLGYNLDATLLNSIPGYPISLPDFITSDLRRAVLQCWVPNSEPGTDVRWLVEEQTLPPLQQYNPPFEKLISSLKQHGLSVLGPLYCAELYQQGRGTFWVVQSRAKYQHKNYFYTLFLSLLGPFASLDVIESDDETEEDVAIPLNELTPDETVRAYKAAISETGLTWVDDKVLEYSFPHLNVYYFGNREVLTLDNLLYYWQD